MIDWDYDADGYDPEELEDEDDDDELEPEEDDDDELEPDDDEDDEMDPDAEDEDDEMDPAPTLGACCICMREDHPSVRNIVMLDLRASKEGEGCWGCFQCGLPMAGAVAVLCDECLVEYEAGRRGIALACVGFPGASERIRIQLLTIPFTHDMTKHPEVEGFGRTKSL